MPTIETITEEGSFDGSIRSAINRNFAALAAGGGGSLVHQATVTLTNAEIIAWADAFPSVELVAAQTGRYLIPVFIVGAFIWVADYGSISATATIDVGTGPGGVVSLASAQLREALGGDVTTLFANGGNSVWYGSLSNPKPGGTNYTIGQVDSDSNIMSAGIFAQFYNGGDGPLSGGDAGNSLAIGLTYYVFDPATGLFE